MPPWFDALLEHVGAVAKGIAKFFWPQTFLAFKVRLFTLWVAVIAGKAALNFDLVFTRFIGGSTFTLRIGGVDGVAITATAITLAMLVLTNILIAVRRARFNRELLEFAREPNVPESLKREVIEYLLHERNQRY